MTIRPYAIAAVAAVLASANWDLTQGQERSRERPPDFVSPEVTAEKSITFRIYAPKAESVQLSAGDLPALGAARGIDLKKQDKGVWEASVGPVPAGAYRYTFNVDGVAVTDPKNTATSESNLNVWSLVYVPGSDAQDVRNVPHGAVAEVTYYSRPLKRFRRMHVYTPPGYQNGEGKFPVFYLLHGAFDSDDAWTTVGRAGFILDNLIAAGKAKPMIVVMPNGHTGPFQFRRGDDDSIERQRNEFVEDFQQSIKPLVERNYRVREGRSQRAIAGLSMGGAQTLEIAFTDLDQYAYVGVFSSGVFGIAGGRGREPSTEWEDNHKSVLDDAKLKPGMRLVWFATGKDDFLMRTTQETVKMLKSHGFDVTFKETEGGHAWLNWRDYLIEFAPLLFNEE